jgi:LacI family transcriptional regulator
MHAKHKKRVALIGMPILMAQSPFNAALIRYAEVKGHWVFAFAMPACHEAFCLLRQLDCEGAIVRVISPKMAREARLLRIPVVNTSSWMEDSGVPTVKRDDVAMGTLSAEHLLEKGFRRFGIVRLPGGHYIDVRCQAFRQAVARAGHGEGIHEFILGSNPITPREQHRFQEWVASLNAPAGLFLPDDEQAGVLMDICRAAGYRIPQDIAVVAAFYHVETAATCVPSLSAVRENLDELAWRAAETLDELMAGRKLGEKAIIIPPLGLVAAESTRTLAIDDPEVARAVEYMRANAASAINVGDVVGHGLVSRTTLERRFRLVMGCAMHDFLLQERLELAKECLMSTPRLSLDVVASRCGLSTRKRLNVLFRKELRQSPAKWRRQALRSAAKQPPGTGR